MFCLFAVLSASNARIPLLQEESQESKNINTILKFFGNGVGVEDLYVAISNSSGTSVNMEEYNAIMNQLKTVTNDYAKLSGKIRLFLTRVIGVPEEALQTLSVFFSIINKATKPFASSNLPSLSFLDIILKKVDIFGEIIDLLGFNSGKVTNILESFVDSGLRPQITIGDILDALDLKIAYIFDAVDGINSILTDNEYTNGEAAERLFLNKTNLETYYQPFIQTFVKQFISVDTLKDYVKSIFGFAIDVVKAVQTLISYIISTINDPIFRMFDPTTNPLKKVNRIVEIMKNILHIKSEGDGILSTILGVTEELSEGALDITDFIPEEIMPKSNAKSLIDAIVGTITGKKSLHDSILQAATALQAQEVLMTVYLFDNLTDCATNPDKTIFQAIKRVDDDFPAFKVMETFNNFTDGFLSLADPDTPITTNENVTLAIDTVIEASKYLINDKVKASEFFDVDYENVKATLAPVKEILSSTNEVKVADILKEAFGVEIYISTIVPILDRVYNLTKLIPRELNIELLNLAIDKFAAVKDALDKNGEASTVKNIIDALIPDKAAKIINAIDLISQDATIDEVIKALPPLYINIYETLRRFAALVPSQTTPSAVKALATATVKSLPNLAGCVVMEDETSKFILQKVVDVSKSISENPKTFTLNTVYEDLKVDQQYFQKKAETFTNDYKEAVIVKGEQGEVMKGIQQIAEMANEGKISVDGISNLTSNIKTNVKEYVEIPETEEEKSNKKKIIIICSAAIAAVIIIAVICCCIFSPCCDCCCCNISHRKDISSSYSDHHHSHHSSHSKHDKHQKSHNKHRKSASSFSSSSSSSDRRPKRVSYGAPRRSGMANNQSRYNISSSSDLY